jgi:hypothetical protein
LLLRRIALLLLRRILALHRLLLLRRILALHRLLLLRRIASPLLLRWILLLLGRITLLLGRITLLLRRVLALHLLLRRILALHLLLRRILALHGLLLHLSRVRRESTIRHTESSTHHLLLLLIHCETLRIGVLGRHTHQILLLHWRSAHHVIAGGSVHHRVWLLSHHAEHGVLHQI